MCACVRVCVQVLSHNLHSVLRIPHDPAALERHFSDDDDGPVSTQGYMPYLNQFILDKVPQHKHTFKRCSFNSHDTLRYVLLKYHVSPEIM